MSVKHLLSLLSVAMVALWLAGCDSKPAGTPAPAPSGGTAADDDRADHDHAEGEDDHDEPSTTGGGSY